MKKFLILMLFCSGINAAPILGVHVTNNPICKWKDFNQQVHMPRGTSIFLNDGPMYMKANTTHKVLGVNYVDYIISSPKLDPLYTVLYKNRLTAKGQLAYQTFLKTTLKRYSNKLVANNKCLIFNGNSAESTWTVSEPFGIRVYDEPTWLGLNEFLQSYPHKGVDGVPAKVYVVDSERNIPFEVIGCAPKLLPGKVVGSAKAKAYQQPYEKLPSEKQEHGNIMDNNVCSLTHQSTQLFPVAVSEGSEIAEKDIEAGLSEVNAELSLPSHTDQSVLSLSEDKANGNRPEEDALLKAIASKHNTLVFQGTGNSGFIDHGKVYNPAILRVGMCIDNPVLGAVTLASDSGIDGPDFCVYMSGLAQKVTEGGGVTSKPAFYGGSSTATSDSAAMGSLIKDQCPSVTRDDVFNAMKTTATRLKTDFLENLPDQALNRVAHVTNVANRQVKTGVVNFKKVMDELMKLPKCQPKPICDNISSWSLYPIYQGNINSLPFTSSVGFIASYTSACESSGGKVTASAGGLSCSATTYSMWRAVKGGVSEFTFSISQPPDYPNCPSVNYLDYGYCGPLNGYTSLDYCIANSSKKINTVTGKPIYVTGSASIVSDTGGEIYYVTMTLTKPVNAATPNEDVWDHCTITDKYCLANAGNVLR